MKASAVLCGALALLVAVSSARARELAGVTFPDTLAVGGRTLVLNGLGLRKKAIFKVYVAGLYLESPSTDAAAILAADRPKAIRMRFLRDLTSEQIVGAFREGFEANATDRAGQQAAFERMLALVPAVREGETITLTYVPGTGTTLAIDDRERGSSPGKAFADAVFSIWLGPKPPTEELKAGILGRG